MPKILVVEDDRANCEMIERLLIIHGHEVITATDGAKALAAARARQPDLILMDMGLPVLNGWQATYRLKTSEATRHIPVIALTAYALGEDRVRCLAVGCDDYDVKPIDVPRLLGKLNALLARPRSGDGGRATTLLSPGDGA